MYRNIVTYLLEARTMQPEREPLLANGSEATYVSRKRPRNRHRNDARCKAEDKQEQTAAARKWLGKHVPAATDTHCTKIKEDTLLWQNIKLLPSVAATREPSEKNVKERTEENIWPVTVTWW
jgi:hypothetical protein